MNNGTFDWFSEDSMPDGDLPDELNVREKDALLMRQEENIKDPLNIDWFGGKNEPVNQNNFEENSAYDNETQILQTDGFFNENTDYFAAFSIYNGFLVMTRTGNGLLYMFMDESYAKTESGFLPNSELSLHQEARELLGNKGISLYEEASYLDAIFKYAKANIESDDNQKETESYVEDGDEAKTAVGDGQISREESDEPNTNEDTVDEWW